MKENNMQFGFALNTETFIQTVLPWLVYNFSKIRNAKHIHFIIDNSKILSTLPKGKNSSRSLE